jgi:hypothetical protein
MQAVAILIENVNGDAIDVARLQEPHIRLVQPKLQHFRFHDENMR